MIEREGDLARVAGTLTIENATAVCAAMKHELGTGSLAFDLGGLTEVDSSALSVMFEMRREAHRHQSEVSFLNIPASLQSLAALYGVTELLTAPAA
jgi:phospholipid transport system transporter-binding protein